MTALQTLRDAVAQRLPRDADGARGRCGDRAVLFRQLAREAGWPARVVHYRGHVVNEVAIEGQWVRVDATEPRDAAEAALVAHIQDGPIVGYDGVERAVRLGPYSEWLQALLDRGAHVLLPRDLLAGAPLADDRPNVVLRHDLCARPERWLPLVHEENQLGLRSVTYVRVDGQAYDWASHVPDWRMFEREGFEFGLHLTAIDRHGLTRMEAEARAAQQLQTIRQVFPAATVQAHGYDDARGVPAFTNYDLEAGLAGGFAGLLQRTGRYAGRLADSVGVMVPGDPLDWIARLEPGRLYYGLWHPEYYGVTHGWAHFEGAIARPASWANLLHAMRTLNARLGDTAYFDSPERPHLRAIADYLRAHAMPGQRVVDLAAGWGVLGLLLDPGVSYVCVDAAFSRIKAAQALAMALQRPTPEVACLDLLTQAPPHGDWAVLAGWEGDCQDLRVLDVAATSADRLLLSYLDADRYRRAWADRFPPGHYQLLGAEAFGAFLGRQRFRVVETWPDLYPDGFPRIVVALCRDGVAP